jgi:hypothetical protein
LKKRIYIEPNTRNNTGKVKKNQKRKENEIKDEILFKNNSNDTEVDASGRLVNGDTR